ncbi:hypothetical protein LTR53_019202, partial [Teratosphaeriaceae sp. CCFEE 6253]
MYQNPGTVGQYGSLHRQNSNDLGQQQQSSQLRIQAPAPPGDMYATNNPPLESPSLNIPGATQPSLTSSNGQSSLANQDQDFPPYDLLYALTDLFFKHINTWCPILHRRTTLDSL